MSVLKWLMLQAAAQGIRSPLEALDSVNAMGHASELMASETWRDQW